MFIGDNNKYSGTFNRTFYESKYIHFAVVTDLVPGNVYFYVCGDDVQRVKSREFSFKMPSYEQHVGSIAIIGDLGQTSMAHSFFQMILMNYRQFFGHC